MANNSFNVVNLDFDQTKESLKAFLQSQETLKDYNFDGSVLNTILDVLSYNTHYQSFYANMLANEMFLDSAVLRPSVVSHAKNLGYVPSSRRASKATVNVKIPSGNVVTKSTYLNRGAEFTGVDSAGTQYKFVLLDTVYANPDTMSFEKVNVYEGVLRRMSYVYDPTKRVGSVLVIPNDKIDTTTIRVRVKASGSDNSGMENTWVYSDSYADITPTSKVFFLQEKEAGMYELFFGDNFLGKQPEAGNIVIVEYLETNGDVANGIETFTTTVAGVQSVEALEPSYGGALEESISRIKFLAPRFYQAQSRAVTVDDYSSLVMKEYPDASVVYVYGGEDANPPQYGKVFIAIKPKSGIALSADAKLALSNKLRKQKSIVTVIPEIIDIDYTDIIIDSIVTYNPNLTPYGVGTLKALIVAYLYSYSVSSLESFGTNLHLSKIIQGIDSLNGSILGNQTSIKLRKAVDFSILKASKGISVDFKNPLYTPNEYYEGNVLVTNTFSHKNTEGTLINAVYAIDNGNGKLNLVAKDSESEKLVVVYPNIGTVDYDTGKINFSTFFSPVSINTYLTITVQPRNTDIFVFENSMLRISRGYSDSVNVSVLTETTRKNTLN